MYIQEEMPRLNQIKVKIGSDKTKLNFDLCRIIIVFIDIVNKRTCNFCDFRLICEAESGSLKCTDSSS